MENDFLTLIRTRRSIRAYKPDAVPADVLARVLEAGTYAPSAMGAQSAMIVAAVSAEARARLTELNAAVIGKDTDPYYGAPVIVVVLGDGGSANYMADGSCVLENLMLAAHAEGLGSVWVNREREIFDSPDGKALLRAWGLPETLRGVGAIALGYAAGPAPGILAHMQGRVAVLHPLCRGCVVKRADGLCRRTKRGVVRVDDDLRDDRRHLPRHTLRTQRTAQPLLQMIADIALTHGRALRQRHGRDGGVRFRGGVERRLDHADLRTVAVADDDLVSLMDEPDKRRAGGGHPRALLGGRIAERVAAECNDDPCHGVTCAAARAAAA